jgi:hypothetical protein
VAANGAAANGAPVTGIGTPLEAGAFLMQLTTVIILMGITLRIATHLVIPTTGVGTHIGGGAILMPTRTTAIILRIGTLMTIAPYQEIDSFTPDHVKFLNPTGPSNAIQDTKKLSSQNGKQ